MDLMSNDLSKNSKDKLSDKKTTDYNIIRLDKLSGAKKGYIIKNKNNIRVLIICFFGFWSAV